MGIVNEKIYTEMTLPWFASEMAAMGVNGAFYVLDDKKERKNLYSNEVHLVLQCVHTYS